MNELQGIILYSYKWSKKLPVFLYLNNASFVGNVSLAFSYTLLSTLLNSPENPPLTLIIMIWFINLEFPVIDLAAGCTAFFVLQLLCSKWFFIFKQSKKCINYLVSRVLSSSKNWSELATVHLVPAKYYFVGLLLSISLCCKIDFHLSAIYKYISSWWNFGHQQTPGLLPYTIRTNVMHTMLFYQFPYCTLVSDSFATVLLVQGPFIIGLSYNHPYLSGSQQFTYKNFGC